jgi:hypothetical protein
MGPARTLLHQKLAEELFMIPMIRAIGKLCTVIAAVAAFLSTAPSYAGSVAFVSSTGTNNNTCSYTQPCTDFATGAVVALSPPGGIGRIICLSAAYVGDTADAVFVQSDNSTLEIDCPAGAFLASLVFQATNNTGRVRGLTFIASMNGGTLSFPGSGTLIMEDCTFVDQTVAGLDLEPTGPLNVVIRNSRISNNASGILLKPQAGGSITATLDHVTIADNTGGGIKIDTTNGPVTADITDSVVSKNSANGINAVGNASGQGMVSIKNSVIAKNGIVGVQANGANAAVLVQTTLLDQNVAGATSVVNGGHISTYGNNSIVGSAGSGFTGSAPLQ